MQPAPDYTHFTVHSQLRRRQIFVENILSIVTSFINIIV